MYQDKTLVCKDCGAEFVFTAGEQEFYAEKASRMSRRDARRAVTQKRMRQSLPVSFSRRPAQDAEKKRRFLSSLATTDPFIAVSAMRK